MPSVGECIPAGRRRAFTLIELMVSISIIAVLLALLLPTLKSVRDEARNSVCLSNQRQLVLGWIQYSQNHGVFPTRTKELHYEPNANGDLVLVESPAMWWDWGGVDWNANEDSYLLSSHRPVNDYVGHESNEQSRAELFQCPSDDFLHYLAPDNPFTIAYAPPIFEEHVSTSNSPHAGETLFDTLGTSYRANDWIWTVIGDKDGWEFGDWGGPTTKNRPDFVDDPSRFPLIGDYGTFLYTRYPKVFLDAQITLQVGFWHGKNRCNLGFQDGSARSVAMGFNPVSPEYSFYLSTPRHAPRSMPFALLKINYQVTLFGYEHLLNDDD